MGATIIPFPTRATDAQRLARVAEHLQSAIAPLTSANMELDRLIHMAGRLLDNLQHYQGADCSDLLDAWLDRLDRWEGKSMVLPA